MKIRSYFLTKRVLGVKRSSSPFPTPLSVLKDDLDVFLKLFVIGSGVAAFFLLKYFHSIGFPDVFLPAIGSSQVLLAFFSGGVIFSVYLVFIFLLPVFMINPSHRDVADIYVRLSIKTWQQIMALLAFPVAMALTSFTQELLPTLGVLLAIQLIVVRIQIKEKVNLSIAWQWVGVAVYWGYVSLFLSFPMLVFLKGAGDLSDMLLWLALFGYVVVLAMLLQLMKRADWKMFRLFVSVLLIGALLWGSDFVISGAARFLGVRNDKLSWYWVDAKVIPTLSKELDSTDGKGCYIKAITPFSTADIHILCRDVNSISRNDCLLALDKSDARLVSTADVFIRKESATPNAHAEQERNNRDICLLSFDAPETKGATLVSKSRS